MLGCAEGQLVPYPFGGYGRDIVTTIVTKGFDSGELVCESDEMRVWLGPRDCGWWIDRGLDLKVFEWWSRLGLRHGSPSSSFNELLDCTQTGWSNAEGERSLLV